MIHRTFAQLAFLAAAFVLGLHAAPATAQVVFYEDLSGFQGASTTNLVVTFEGFTPVNTHIFIPPEPPISLGGVTFTPLENMHPTDNNLIVATPGGPTAALFSVPLSSNTLCSSGNENIDMDFADGPTAVGFDTYTNPYGHVLVSVYDAEGVLLATHLLQQAPSTQGFLGITSSVPIGKVNWYANRGGDVHTGIANVRTGAITSAPLTFFLSASDMPDIAGGMTMTVDPVLSQVITLNLLSSPSWFTEEPLTGTLEGDAVYTLQLARLAGLNLPVTYRLSATNSDGSNEQVLGEVKEGLGIGIGNKTVEIPVNGQVELDRQHLKLSISSLVNLNLNLQLGNNTFLNCSQFVEMLP